MFQFFKRKTSKDIRTPVCPRAANEQNDRQKDVVNLLIPSTDYAQKSGVGSILQIMAGKKRKSRKKRTESCRIPPETNTSIQRTLSLKCDVGDENNSDRPTQADFVKALVLNKYAKKDHVSLVYVDDKIDEKKHAEALLREIARSIDCTVDNIEQMGATDSKQKTNNITDLKKDLNKELDRLKAEVPSEVQDQTEVQEVTDAESPNVAKKSNLKLPKQEEGCSDDDRSDNGKKRVTFQKHIIFDDGDRQTDDEMDSSFESLASEDDYLDDALENDNTTVININESTQEPLSEAIRIKVEDVDQLEADERSRLENSDSGFLDIGVTKTRDVVSESESETEEIIEEIIEEEICEEFVDEDDDEKSIVAQDTKFQNQVAHITELATNRSEQAERARDLIAACRKEIEEKDREIEQLKCELAAAYKESELIRQRSRSLEDELVAARSCSADLAEQLKRQNEECVRELRSELDQAQVRQGELESRVLALERDRDRLEQEKAISEQKAVEALATAEANTAKWRSAHEAARSQAAARAERILADCEWKMREIEKRARDAEKENRQLKESYDKLKSENAPHLAELTQLRGIASEQQRSVQSLTLQLQKIETREEALKLEVHRLKELLERELESGKEKEARHLKKIKSLEESHTSALESLRNELTTSAANTRAALERAHAERTRVALAQLREESEHQARNSDRKLREVTTRFENLKEVLAAKEAHFESALSEARSKADWDIMQLRHLLDKADIDYANKVDSLNQRFEEEKEQLIEEWSQKIKETEEQAATEVSEVKKLAETTRLKLIAERLDQVNKLKEQHRKEMDDQWDQFMIDKENCLARMKLECRQEGDEERIKREKELLEEIAELKSQVHSKSNDFDNLAVKAAACGRTLAVTEQELREALAREKELREKRSDDAVKIRQTENKAKDQVEHLTRKCACLRKLFDDMRARLAAKERAAEQEAKAREKELHHLRGEVARLTKILVEQSSPKLGARTRADGCETLQMEEKDTRRKGMSNA